MVRVIFITGTDTGVGKTVLTALLLAHLRRQGTRAVALKPFCSGSRADVRLLHALHEGEFTADEINPFYFPEPVAPLVSARRHRRVVRLEQVLEHIARIRTRLGELRKSQSKTVRQQKETILLVEGVGGLLVPLGEDFTVLDLIRKLNCETIVVARNRLGTLNHTLLTWQALRGNVAPRHRPKLVLMAARVPDASSDSNGRILSEWLGPGAVYCLPWLVRPKQSAVAVSQHAARLKGLLRKVLSAQPRG